MERSVSRESSRKSNRLAAESLKDIETKSGTEEFDDNNLELNVVTTKTISRTPSNTIHNQDRMETQQPQDQGQVQPQQTEDKDKKIKVPVLKHLRSEIQLSRKNSQPSFVLTNRQLSGVSRPLSIRDRPLGGTGSLNNAVSMKLMSPREAKNYVLEHGAKELEQQENDGEADGDPTSKGGIDPFAQQKRPSFKLAKKIWLVIGAIPFFSWVLLILCWLIDKLTEAIPGNSFTLYDLVYSTFNPDVDQGRSIVEAVLNTMSVIFGLLITVIGIILQLSANRFTSHVTALFFKDQTIGAFLSYVVFCNAFGFWVYLSVGDRYIPRASILLSVIMATSQLAFLFPFLAYLFFFLEPDKVVQKIMMNGLTAASESINDHGRDIDKQQVKATLAVEHLMDAANSALKKKDKNITAEIVDALCSFVIAYGNYKVTHKMNVFWFKVPLWIRQSPDFLTLSDQSVDDINDRKTWMEWKILRQYQMLFNESLKHMKELCYHIAMNSRLIGETAAKRGDVAALDLTVKFFNTYLRASINRKMGDVRTVYNVLFQYRSMAEYILEYGHEIAKDGATEENELEMRAVRIAKCMRYYSFVCLQQKLFFLVEVISHDIRVLCETALKCNSIAHDKLLHIFLTVGDGSDGQEEKALQGVRRAQVILATHYLVEGRPEFAEKIHRDFAGESHKRLWGLMQELLNVPKNPELWEVSERGTNFTYMTPEQKAQLPIFFAYFKNFISDKKEDHLTPAERKKLERQQELMNFD